MDALDFEVKSGMAPNGVIMAPRVSPNGVKVLNGNGVLGKEHSVARNTQHRCAVWVPAVGQCAPLEANENIRISTEAVPSLRIQPWGICCKMKRATRMLFKRNGQEVIRMKTARKKTVAQDRRKASMRCAVPQVANPILRDNAATWDRRTEPRGRHSGGKPIEAHPRDRVTLRTTNKKNIVISGRWSFTTRAGRGPLVKELIPALIIASHMSDESVPISAMGRDGFTLVREPSADLLHEIMEANPAAGVHFNAEARISARTVMTKKGTEPRTKALDERVLAPARRVVTMPWAEVEADGQGLLGRIDPRNCIILHARLGRGKKGSNIAVASIEGSSRCKFFFLTAVHQCRVISPVPAEQLVDMRALTDRIPFCTDWCREDGSCRGTKEWNVTGRRKKWVNALLLK